MKYTYLAIAISLLISGCNTDSDNTNTNIPGPDITHPAETNYKKAIENWTKLLYPEISELNNSLYQELNDKNIELAHSHLNSMKKDNENYLWSDKPLYREDNRVHEKNTKASFDRLRAIAIGYNLDNNLKNEQVLNDIIYGLNLLLDNAYTDTVEQHMKDNWWEWEIGTPKSMHDVIFSLHPHLPDSVIQKAIKASRWHQKDPTIQFGDSSPRSPITSLGANRVDSALVVLQRGILAKNKNEIDLAINSIPDVLDAVKESDGFYSDGSFIQHEDIPYIGTYGMIILSNISRIMVLINETGIELSDERYKLIDEYIFNSVAPFLYKMQMMDAVNGRAIARGWSQNKGEGRGALGTLLRYYDSRNNEVKIRLGALLKGQISNDSDEFFLKNKDYRSLEIANRIMKDEKIAPAKELEGNFVFYNMDRVVHRKNGYAFTLALHSNRIGNYECGDGNTENTKGWYTADGMTYLYDADHNQYTDWFPLIDSRSQPGTTTIGENIGDCAGRSKSYPSHKNYKKEMTWVGGVSNGKYGSYGANLYTKAELGFANEKFEPLYAKKSYFMFDDEIVMIGSDIHTDKTSKVTTTIENRKLLPEGNNNITVDGKKWTPTIDFEKKKVNNYYHVQGNVAGSQLGIYLPKKQSVSLTWDKRNGNWESLYPLNKEKMENPNISGVVLLSNISHVTGPSQKPDDYAYVMLPSLTNKQTQDYSQNPDIEIKEISDKIHAVYEKKLNLYSANIWTSEPLTTEHIETNGDFSIMIQNDNDKVNVWISQPNRKNNTVKFKYKLASGSKLLDDADNRVELNNDYWYVNTNNLNGSTYHFSYLKD